MPETCVRRQRTYWTTCGCATCTRDRSRKRKLHSMGHNRAISHERAWAALAAKFEQGWTARAISSATGLPDHYFTRHHARWRRGEECLIGPALAEVLVNIGTPTRGQVGAEPTRRRLRALSAIGYGLDVLSAETGVGASTLAAARNTNVRVGARVATAVTAAYDRLHMTPGDNMQALRMAREKGWPPPLAYDDIDTDEQPRGLRTEDRRDLLTEWAELEAAGESIHQAARRLGVTVGAIERAQMRARKVA